jgi:hypothetical protein
MPCSICAGTGKLLTGEKCVCGDGSAEGEVVALRGHIAELERVVDKYRESDIENSAQLKELEEALRAKLADAERERDEARLRIANAASVLYSMDSLDCHTGKPTCKCRVCSAVRILKGDA